MRLASAPSRTFPQRPVQIGSLGRRPLAPQGFTPASLTTLPAHRTLCEVCKRRILRLESPGSGLERAGGAVGGSPTLGLEQVSAGAEAEDMPPPRPAADDP